MNDIIVDPLFHEYARRAIQRASALITLAQAEIFDLSDVVQDALDAITSDQLLDVLENMRERLASFAQVSEAWPDQTAAERALGVGNYASDEQKRNLVDRAAALIGLAGQSLDELPEALQNQVNHFTEQNTLTRLNMYDLSAYHGQLTRYNGDKPPEAPAARSADLVMYDQMSDAAALIRRAYMNLNALPDHVKESLNTLTEWNTSNTLTMSDLLEYYDELIEATRRFMEGDYDDDDEDE